MAYIGSRPADQVITGADIQDASVQLADLSATAQDALGKVDFYGFKKSNGCINFIFSFLRILIDFWIVCRDKFTG